MFFLALLSLPTFSYLIVQQPKVQQILVQKLTEKLSVYLGTSVTLSKADIDLFNHITFHNLCIRSPKNDTIFYTPNFSFQVNAFTLSTRYVDIMNVTIQRPQIHFKIDSTGSINFQFIINKLSAKNPARKGNPLIISIREVNIQDANFFLTSWNHVPKAYGINFSDIHLNPLNLKVTGFGINSGYIDMNIKNLECADKSGFILRNFESQLKIYKQYMVFNHLQCRTDRSNVKARKVHLKFDDFKEFATGIFGKKVKLDIDLKPSEISTIDLSYFAVIFKDYNTKFRLTGKVKGIINDLKGKDIELTYGIKTFIKGNVNINGLPNFTNAFIYADIKNLITTPDDIQHFYIPGHSQGHIILPKNFKSIDYITYKGKFTGFVTDFVAYGLIKTNLGTIESDLSFKPDTSGYFKLNGRLSTTDFNLGTFVNKYKRLGDISLNVLVNGQVLKDKYLKMRLDGKINSVVWNGYKYQNIKLDGTLSNSYYDGFFAITDPNLTADFMGKINLAGQTPMYNFKADIKKANLFKLNFDKSDSNSYLSLFATADFEGNSIDNINGTLKLWNATFKKTNKEIHVNNFLLYNKNKNDTNRIIVQSDLIDAEISGIYHYSDLSNAGKLLIRHYLPSMSTDSVEEDTISNNFSFNIQLKNTRQLTDYFIPGLYISKDTKLSGNFSSLHHEFNFIVTIPLLQHYSKKWYNAYISGKSSGTNYSLMSGCNTLKLNNSNRFDNLTLISNVKNDSIFSQVRWNNWDTIAYNGNISFLTTFTGIGKSGNPITCIQIQPSKIMLRDSLWNIHAGMITVDSSDVSIDNFALDHQNQLVNIYGNISGNPDKKLMLECKNINLGHLSSMVHAQKWKPEGILNGKAEFSNLYGNLFFHATLNVDSLCINDQKFGTSIVNANFDNADKNIFIDANAHRGSVDILSVKGLYSVQSKTIDFNINLYKLMINLFEPFVASVFSGIHGEASGKVRLSGPLKSPVLNGSLRINNASFVVNYLKTNYHFNTDVTVDKNKFILKNIEVFDRFRNDGSNDHLAVVNGKIDVGHFKEVYIDVMIDARNLECLNTVEKDNSMFYGEGFATGKVKIKGPPRNIELTSINHTVTNKGTKIYIPLETKSDLTQSNFIKIVNKQIPEQPFDQYEIDSVMGKDKSGYGTGGFKLNLDISMTTDAQVQLIFDAKIGDRIKGTGTGDLNMRYENANFTMFGDYNIENGDYLFTLRNVIEKHFILNNGGTISWNGSPMDATINLTAYYQVNASLSNLYPPNFSQLIQSSSRIKVNCNIALTDKLMNPSIKCDITLPSADQATQDLVNATISTEDEKYKQFAALMIAGSFLPSSNLPTQNTGTAAASSTSFEFVSNQLSNWFSQINNAFNININYRPQDTYTNQYTEFGITTEISPSVSVKANVEKGGDVRNPLPNAAPTNNNPLADVELDYKLTKNGKLQFKTFNRPNQSIDAVSTYTQGVGLIYKEDFNSFIELIKHYYSMLFGRKEEKIKPVPEDIHPDEEQQEPEPDSAQNKQLHADRI